MYDHRTSNPFYSVSLETKLAALPDIIGMNVVDVLDDISDGAGGGEFRRIGRQWVIVLENRAPLGRAGNVHYVALTPHADEPTVIERATVIEYHWDPSRGLADDHRVTMTAAVNVGDVVTEIGQ